MELLDSLEVENCIRCNNGDSGRGKLLVCSEEGCPIALHEECMCAKPFFDQMGSFYCPYCAYKREFVRVRELRRKAMASKDVLSKFIDAGAGNVCGCGEGRDGGRVRDRCGGVEGEGPEEEGNEMRREVEDIGGREGIDEELQEEEIVEETPQEDVGHENDCHVQEKTNKDNGPDGLDQGDEDGIRVPEENEDISEDEEQMQPEENELPANGTVVPESDELDTGSPLVRKKRFKKKAQKRKQPESAASLRTAPSPSRESSSRQTRSVEEDPKNQKEKAKTFSMKEKEKQEFARNLVHPNGKRKRLNWSDEELEMLKEGVRIYAKENQNMPWKQILEFGCDVFHLTRLPVDLKDKWRQLTGKR